MLYNYCALFVALFFFALFIALLVALSTSYLKFCCISPWDFVSKDNTACYILKYISSKWNKELLSHVRVYRKRETAAQTDGRIAADGALDTDQKLHLQNDLNLQYSTKNLKEI